MNFREILSSLLSDLMAFQVRQCYSILLNILHHFWETELESKIYFEYQVQAMLNF